MPDNTPMSASRLEAFSDGVIAIIITIMVLGLQVPKGTDLAALRPLLPVLLSYVLSFVYVGIYWNNHHHLFRLAESVSGAVLWANLHLLFWLSLLPFSTGWMGENALARWPTVLYGVNLLCCALAWAVLQGRIIHHQGAHSALARAVARDLKGKASSVLYAVGIVLAWGVSIRLGLACYVFVALLWLVPDRRVEKLLARQ